ncbi:MAG: MutS-related protein [Gemmatimonadaceae bacterium]
MAHPALVALAVLLVGGLLLLLPRFFSRTKDALQVVRGLHALRPSRHVDMALMAAYHVRFPAEPGTEALDDRTWRDLDLDQVFLSLDYTASEPGRQYLYHCLRSPHFSIDPLARLDRAARHLAADDAMATRARIALSELSDRRAAHLEDLLFGELPHRPRFWWLFPLLTAAAVTCLALIAIWPQAALVWLGLCVVNVGVQIFFKPTVKRFIPALHELPAFLRASRTLGTLSIPPLADESSVLREGAQSFGPLRLASRWLMFEPEQSNELAGSFYEYANLLFLLDVNAFVFSTETLRNARATARGMFTALGYIDVAQSVAAWRGTLSQWTTPEFTPVRKALHVEAVSHPLIPDAVANSLDADGASVLITGSNMSGKTTFVRTLGVNAVLAQTLNTVCASKWSGPMLRVRTSIQRADNLIAGKSYYLSEVESVLTLVRAKESGEQHLFLLDEIFRGTNTTERVAAAYAVLAHLNAGHDLAVAATHDIELLELLKGTYAMHHFREQVANDGLTFDYLIQPGVSSTRNAIALLKAMRYPDSLVADALATVEWQRERGRHGAVL